MFAKMCFVFVNGDWPSQDAPSPPMWVKVDVLRSIQIDMKWQPIPATARLPSGTFVDVLCGQPEQKYGVRAIAILDWPSAASFALMNAMRARIRSEVWKRSIR